MGRLARGLVLVGVAVSLAGCGVLPRNPVPPELTAVASIPGMPDVRAWAGRPSAAMARDFERSFQQESPADFPRGPDGIVRYPHLALSGGGSNGAFGAGFLNGWSATGSRPVFKVVTGVSTGALMAPFAFLGPHYDVALHEFYTTTTNRDIFAVGSILISLLRGDSLADTGPLAALIARHVDAEFLRKIADAHNRGRRLYMGSVDLDSQQFVVWNMGLIAANGHPDALELFRKVMLASASIPIAFPPVLFEVEADGRRYDEMHVDGFVGANIFLNAGLVCTRALSRAGGTRRSPRGHLRDPQRTTHRSRKPDAAVAAWDRFAGHRRLDPLWCGWGSDSHLCVRAARPGELPLGNDRRERRPAGLRGLRPGEDGRAVRDRPQGRARRTGLGDATPGVVVGRDAALTGAGVSAGTPRAAGKP